MYLPVLGDSSNKSRHHKQQEDDSMGNAQCHQHLTSHRVETLTLTCPMDVERAMTAVTLPKRIDIQASLLSSKKASSNVAALLRRVGCLELCIQGKSAAAPRRLFEYEVVDAISQVKQHKLRKLILKNLDIQRVHPEAEEEDVEEAAPEAEGGLVKHRLSKLTRLEELHVMSCRLGRGVLEDVLNGTAYLPRLTQVTLNLKDALPEEDKALLVQTATYLLKHRPNLTSLAISEYPEDLSFWQYIAATKTLSHLSLAIYNNAEIQNSFSWYMLQMNASIRQLELRVAPGVSLTALKQFLKKNTTVASLLLHLEEDPTCVSQWLAKDVLEYDNFTLTTIHLLCHNIYGYKVRIPCPRVDFLTKLNRQGRRRRLLLGSTNSCLPGDAEWIDAISNNTTYDVSSSYYWLRSNPNLFSTTNNTAAVMAY